MRWRQFAPAPSAASSSSAVRRRSSGSTRLRISVAAAFQQMPVEMWPASYRCGKGPENQSKHCRFPYKPSAIHQQSVNRWGLRLHFCFPPLRDDGRHLFLSCRPLFEGSTNQSALLLAFRSNKKYHRRVLKKYQIFIDRMALRADGLPFNYHIRCKEQVPTDRDVRLLMSSDHAPALTWNPLRKGSRHNTTFEATWCYINKVAPYDTKRLGLSKPKLMAKISNSFYTRRVFKVTRVTPPVRSVEGLSPA